MCKKFNKIMFLLLAVLFMAAGTPLFSQDLNIEYQLYSRSNSPGSYFTFKGPIRYIEADKDYADAATGASRHKSTSIFQPYRVDVKGKSAMPDGLRGLFLFAVAPYQTRVDDNFSVSRASDGTITINYVHRGTAYQLITDRAGRFSLPAGSYKKRVIGYIQGPGPQVLHRDFSTDGTAARVDWNKVWDERIPGGREIAAGVAARTGAVVTDAAASDSMFYWDGTLQASLEANGLLKVAGGLNAVKR